MDNLDLQNVLSTAIAKAQIIGHFQYAHNLFQSPVQINEIFSMLDTIINDIIGQIGDVIPDINLAPYKEGAVDSSRANLCWIELKENYYGLILNMQHGIKYRKFTDDEIQNLVISGQVSSWYLISKIQNLSYLVTSDNEDDLNSSIKFFKNLIIDIIERFFEEHETSKDMHPAGRVSLKKLEQIFSRVQIQNSNSITPSNSSESESSTGGKWSQSLIKTLTGEICWQSASAVPLYEMTSAKVAKIIKSDYLNERSDVEAFLEETYYKRKNVSYETKPNVFCFLSVETLPVPYVDLNYVVESQLHGYVEVEYDNTDERDKIYPDTSPILIQRGKNDIAFMTVIKIDTDMNKRIKRIVTKNHGGDRLLPNLHITFNITGISKRI